MIRTVGDLVAQLNGFPQHLKIGFCTGSLDSLVVLSIYEDGANDDKPSTIVWVDLGGNDEDANIEAMRFHPGEVVHLRGGYQLMTVRYQVGSQAARDTGNALGVHVDWVGVSGKPHQNVFAPEQLVLVHSKEPQ